ncbi:MAG: class I SAM-dependent methyltransferase [Desulfobacterales bacterium]|nr:class I SAM-dependent methyltransferase [Desulfobacterales bacterium]
MITTSNQTSERRRCSDRPPSKLAFMIISLMHDNPLLLIFKDPYRILRAAGLRAGQEVLEVGCGPGFFTIPAARMVGDEGTVYAVDVNPLAIDRVRKKIETNKLTNIRPMLTNASDTGLPDQTIDLAFMFGLPRIVGGQENVVSECNRILKPDGTLSFMKTRGSERKLVQEVERQGFLYSHRRARIFLFTKGIG